MLLSALIVMGTHGRTGVAHFMLGNVAERWSEPRRASVLTIR
jgi:nucleotide-binding universal stress UspA family protein